MITLTPALSRALADHVQGLDVPARHALYARLDAAETEADILELLTPPA